VLQRQSNQSVMLSHWSADYNAFSSLMSVRTHLVHESIMRIAMHSPVSCQ